MPNPVINRRLVSPRSTFSPVLCNVVLASADGFGDSFECYPEGDITSGTLPAGGIGWDGGWTITYSTRGVQADDDFNSYAVQDPVTATLSGGTGWVGGWVIASTP